MNILGKNFFKVALVSVILLVGVFFISKETGLINTDASCRYTLTTIYNSTDTPTECSNGSWGEWADTANENEQKRSYEGVYVVKSYQHKKNESKSRRGLSGKSGCDGIGNSTITVNGSAVSGASLVSTTITPFACSFEQTKTIRLIPDNEAGDEDPENEDEDETTITEDPENEDGGKPSTGGEPSNDDEESPTEEVITTGEVTQGDATGDSTVVTTQEISGSISDMECSVDKNNWNNCDTVIKIGSWDDKVFVRYKTSNQCTTGDLNWIVNSGSNVDSYAYPMSINTIGTGEVFGSNISNLLELQLTQKPSSEAYDQIFIENLNGAFEFPCTGSVSKDLRIKILDISSSEI